MDENNQNNSNPIALVFLTGDHKNVLVEIDDKKLKNTSFKGIRMKDWDTPAVPYDWDLRRQIMEQIGVILDATIVNTTQKEAVFRLISDSLGKVARGREDIVRYNIEDVRKWNDGIFALGSGSLKTAEDGPHEISV